MDDIKPLGSVDPSIFIGMMDRANQVANTTQLDSLLTQMLSIALDVSHAAAGICYLLGQEKDVLLEARAALGLPYGKQAVGSKLDNEEYLACQCMQVGRAISESLVSPDARELVDLSILRGLTLRNTVALPIPRQVYPLGVLQLFNVETKYIDLLQKLCDRLAPDISKLIQLQTSESQNRRMQSMLGFLGRIDPSLETQQNLEIIIENACKLLNAEVCSLFLVDEPSGDLMLQFSSRDDHNGRPEPLRVPRGEGIIGYVVQSGEPVMTKDAGRDMRHYKALDDATNLVTRSMLAVPLYQQGIQLPNGRPVSRERIIGGIEAINKVTGEFDAVDLAYLQKFAEQAVNVMQLSSLYHQVGDFLMDSIITWTAAIDAKDPYTKGHSQRVSKFAVEIAIELGMDSEMVHHIYIGSMLHDVGKLRIPDSILLKPGSLTDEEWKEMKKHPRRGVGMVQQLRSIRTEHELQAIEQHHERLDGSGYPFGLKGDEISLVGRIVAVADVYDALTTDRPYRKAVSPEEAFNLLLGQSDVLFDRAVVEAFQQVLLNKKAPYLVKSPASVQVEQDIYWTMGD